MLLRLVGPSAYPCAFSMPSRQRLETRNICVVHNSERRERGAGFVGGQPIREVRFAPAGAKIFKPVLSG
jgi:hypothetical protein